tara:strand:- start:44 stop:619 length:576 start_codon:yes stop_codon:yes gene_type:complete
MPVTINGNGSITGLAQGGIDGTKVVTSAAQPAGSIVKVQQNLKKDTIEEGVAQGTETGTLFSASFTPTSSSNKILVQFSGCLGIDNANNGTRIALRLYKDGSLLTDSLGDTAGNRNRVTALGGTVGNEYPENIGFVYLDTAGTTNAITYSIKAFHGRGATCNIELNQDGTDANFNYTHRPTSSFTFMEIAV